MTSFYIPLFYHFAFRNLGRVHNPYISEIAPPKLYQRSIVNVKCRFAWYLRRLDRRRHFRLFLPSKQEEFSINIYIGKWSNFTTFFGGFFYWMLKYHMPNFKADLRVNLLTTQSPFKSACLLKEVYIFLKSLNNYEARNLGVRVTVPPTPNERISVCYILYRKFGPGLWDLISFFYGTCDLGISRAWSRSRFVTDEGQWMLQRSRTLPMRHMDMYLLFVWYFVCFSSRAFDLIKAPMVVLFPF